MQTESLVLFKTRTQRLVEMIALPTVGLAVGPAMRALLGDDYQIYQGLLAAVLLAFLMATLSSHWAARHGGEWVSKAERLRRLAAETSATPGWQYALATMAMAALTLFGIFLIIEPYDQFGRSIGGAPDSLALIVLIAVWIGSRALIARRTKRQLIVVDEPPPADHFRSELRRVLPRMYLAYGIAGVAGFAIGLQFQDAWRFGSFMIAFFVISGLLSQRLLQGSAPRRVYPAMFDPNLGAQMVSGLLLWGVPMGIAFSGATILGTMDTPELIPIYLAVVIVLSVIGGLAVGALIYVLARFTDPRQKNARSDT